jgi:hypothetical protein
MASEIIGLFTNPQQYLAAQDASMQQQFARNAQLAPLQRASMLYQQAGYQAGQGIGGALGGVDPQLEMISKRNALLSQLDQSNPESFMKVAQVAAQIGDNEFAMAIANAGRKAQSEMALTTQRTAEKMTNEQRNALAYASQFGTPDSQAFKDAYKERFDQLTLKAGQANKPFEFEAREARLQELKAALRVLESQPTPNLEAIQRLKDSIQSIEGVEKQKSTPSFGTEAERKAKSMYGKQYGELTQQQATAVDKAVEVSEQTKAKLTAPPSAQQAKQVLQSKTDIASKIENEALTASDQITLAQSLRELAPKAFTGFASNAKLSASKVASAFGIPTKGGSESEIIDQILGQMTIGAAGQLKGALSDKDVLFLKQTIGNRGLSVDTLLYVADEIERRALQNRNLNQRINKFVGSGGSLNDLNFETEKTKSSAEVKKKYTEYRDILKKVANNTATLEEAKRAKDIRDELGL